MEARGGDGGAAYALGRKYMLGEGVPEDRLEGVHWWRLAAEAGHAEAQSYLGWPITSETQPSLTCAPRGSQGAVEGELVFHHLEPINFEVSLQNDRPFIEQMILADVASYHPEHVPRLPNTEVRVYELDGQTRRQVSRRLFESGGNKGPYGDESRRGHHRRPGISRSFASVSLRLPLEGDERKAEFERFLEMVGEEAEKVGLGLVETLRNEEDRASASPYLDHLFGNRIGRFEVVCSYRSQDPRFWDGELLAPPLRIRIERGPDWADLD